MTNTVTFWTEIADRDAFVTAEVTGGHGLRDDEFEAEILGATFEDGAEVPEEMIVEALDDLIARALRAD